MSEYRRHIMASSTNENMQFYFESIDGGTLGFAHHQSNTVTPSFQYSMDGGNTWQNFPVTTVAANGDAVDTISVDAGNKIMIKGINSNGTSQSSNNIVNYNCFRTETGNWNIGGNISYLTYGKYDNINTKNYEALFINCNIINAKNCYISFKNLTINCFMKMFYNCTSLTSAPKVLPATTLIDSCYQSMFESCTSLTSAPALPATTLVSKCYYNMFYGCSSLVNAPELPATTLTGYCYQSMFQNCISLTTAPELPATTLATSCYKSMFQNCTSLITAPELPATTLAASCYNNMFRNCSSLTNIPNILPATTLTGYCYQSMFQDCISLTTAPELPATTLIDSCYSRMFRDCSSIKYIKCLAEDKSATNCIENWVTGVPSGGTFVKKTGVTWASGNNGIPNGWTVEEADS